MFSVVGSQVTFKDIFFIGDWMLRFFPFWHGTLGTKPEGLLRTNYNSVFTSIAASLRGSHDILKGETAEVVVVFGFASLLIPYNF